MTTRLLCVLVIATSLALGACSSAKSSSSPSRWSSNSSKSSSGSSGGGEDEKADKDQSKYEQDVTATTAATVKSGGGASQIMRDVGDVANDHGVTDWENEPNTFQSIGRGLQGVSVDEFESLSQGLSGESDVRKKLLYEGYTESP